MQFNLEGNSFPEKVFLRLTPTDIDTLDFFYDIGDGKSSPCSCPHFTQLTQMKYNHVIVPYTGIYSGSDAAITLKK